MTLLLLEILRRQRRYIDANQSANLRLNYAGYNMLEIHFLFNPFSDPNFKNIKKLEIAIL